MDLGISTNPTPELYTIKVAGEIDISNADSLRNAIDLALEQPTEAVELDFAPGELHRFDGHWRACGRRAPRGRPRQAL